MAEAYPWETDRGAFRVALIDAIRAGAIDDMIREVLAERPGSPGR